MWKRDRSGSQSALSASIGQLQKKIKTDSPTASEHPDDKRKIQLLTEALALSNKHHKQLQHDVQWLLDAEEQNRLHSISLQQRKIDLQLIPVQKHSASPCSRRCQIENLRKEHRGLKNCMADTIKFIQSTFADFDVILASTIKQCLTGLESHNKKQSMLQETIETLEVELELFFLNYESEKKQCERFKIQFDDANKQRQSLHNSLQELRGNIRVYCRIRPMSDRLGLSESKEGAIAVNHDRNIITVKSSVCNKRFTNLSFKVDNVITPEKTQECLYGEIRPLVTSVLDGYNACILAYGQTGSGKTHTMLGDLDCERERGICVRVFEDLLDRLICRNSPLIETRLGVSCIEVYNEQVFDLLNSKSKLSLRVDKNKIFFPERIWRFATSKEQFLSILRGGCKSRSIGETDKNQHSSRSHCIISIKVEEISDVGNPCQSKIHLVDLAGSERLSYENSLSKGASKFETQHINKSLSSLRHVLLQLRRKQNHISYRDSRLTMVLQDSIGGNAKTMMIICVNPSSKCVKETTCSLVFGEKTTKVELGRAKNQREGNFVQNDLKSGKEQHQVNGNSYLKVSRCNLRKL